MFKKSLKAKIMLAFAAVLLCMLGLSLFASRELSSIDKIYGELFILRIEKIKDAYELHTRALSMAYAARGYLIYGTEEAYADFHRGHEEAREILARLPATVKTETGRQLLAKVDAAEADYYRKAGAVLEAKRAKAPEEEVQAKLSLAAAAVKPLFDSVQEFTSFQLRRLQEDRTDTEARGRRVVFVIIASSAVILVLSLLLAFFTAGRIAAPLKLVDERAARIARGDLTGEEVEVKTQDEVGSLARSFNAMLAGLRDIAEQLQEKAKTLAATSAQISAGAQQVSAGAGETASTIGEVAATVERVAANAREIADESASAAGYSEEGGRGVRNVVAQMELIMEATQRSREVVANLSASAARIGQIVEMITHIADQTNLLALNAAIEAARAGEHGRGFAVVAEEVRKLAEQSAAAAKEIQELIGGIQEEAARTVRAMEENSRQVGEGTEVVRQVGDIFTKIIASVQRLAGEIKSVSAAVQDISAAVQNVAATAEEQNATMEEVASSTQSLAAMANELEGLAGRFSLSRGDSRALGDG
jgi:methyl-accepting chemotaxis protein